MKLKKEPKDLIDLEDSNQEDNLNKINFQLMKFLVKPGGNIGFFFICKISLI